MRRRGCIAFTVDGVAVSAHVDGHVSPATMEALREMARTLIAADREKEAARKPVVIAAARRESG